MPPDPVPIAAEWTSGAPTMWVQFDRPLAAGALDTFNWWMRLNNKTQNISAAAASGDKVTLSRSDGVTNNGPHVVSYRPPPFDVKTPTNQFAAAFENFPVTVNPP